MSQRGIDSLPSRVIETLKSHGLHQSNFPDLMKSAENNKANYFMRIFSTVKPRVVGIIWQDFISTAHEIVQLHKDDKTRNVGRHCEWCEYESLCRAEFLDLDAEFIQKKDYEIEKDESA